MSRSVALRKPAIAKSAVSERGTKTIGAFATWQPKYAEYGIATFPVSLEGEKKPLVGGYLKLGLATSRRLAFRFPKSNAFGFALGQRSGIAVLDIDIPDERVLADAMSRHGATPVVVRTGSGNWHAWYRHNGEKRLIRPWTDRPIDLLGAGYVVAPPSKGAYEPYTFVHGGLDDLGNLPLMRGLEDLQPTRGRPASPVIRQGSRNNQLWEHCMIQARHCDDIDALIDVARTFNQCCEPPLSENEVIKAAASAWGYQQSGNNWFGSNGMVAVPRNILHCLDPDELFLFMRLRDAHVGLRNHFAIAVEAMSNSLGWDKRRFKRARDGLIAKDVIEFVHRGGKYKGDASLYRFTNVLLP